MKLKVSKYIADRIARKKSDFKVQATTSSSPGGQHSNKVATAVRITDKITGLAVFCQEHKSQSQNKSAAFLRLAEKMIEYYRREEFEQIVQGDHPSQQWVRSYKEKHNLVVDHRLEGRQFSYSRTLAGDLDGIHEELLVKAVSYESTS